MWRLARAKCCPGVQQCDTAADESCNGLGAWLDASLGPGPVHCLAGPDAISPNGVTADGAGNVVFSFNSPNIVVSDLGSSDVGGIIVAKLDAPYTALLWTRSFGDVNLTRGGVAVDGMGNVALGGLPAAAVDLGGANITTVGQPFVFELGP